MKVRYKMKCTYCKYEWVSRKGRPVECCKCKRYLKGTDDEVLATINDVDAMRLAEIGLEEK